MDERPLRQEDYRAMAEENRRLHKRIAQLQEEKENKLYGSSEGRKFLVFILDLLFIVILPSIAGLCMANGKFVYMAMIFLPSLIYNCSDRCYRFRMRD